MGNDFGMSSHLRDLVTDLIEQIGQTNELLDQRHYRLLLNLSAVEKVKCFNHLNLILN